MSELYKKHLERHNLEVLKQFKKGRERSFDEQKHDRDTRGKFVPKGQTGTPAKGKTSKDDANYTANSSKPQKCGNCKFIIRGNPNKCSKVEGTISTSGWSRFWKSTKKKDDPTKV